MARFEVVIKTPGAEVLVYSDDDDETLGWILGRAIGMLPPPNRHEQIFAQAIRCVYEGNDMPCLHTHEQELHSLLKAAIAIDEDWERHDKELDDAVKRHRAGESD